MRPARKGKVLCVGRTYCDLLFTGVPAFPMAGEEIYSQNFAIHAGGGAFITAAHLASFGVKSMLCSLLPSGPLGQEVLQKIEQSGVDLTYCEIAPANGEPQVTVVVSGPEDRSFLTNRIGPSVPPSILKALNDPDVVHLHIAELATLAENPDLPTLAKQLGISVSLDCSWDEKLLRNDQTVGLLKEIDIFLPNEKEIRALLGLKGSLLDSAATIAELARWVVIKQAAKGAILVTKAYQISAEAAPANVVDSTGAGDAFNAGFLGAWLGGLNDEKCLKTGNRAGGQAVQTVGGASVSGLRQNQNRLCFDG